MYKSKIDNWLLILIAACTFGPSVLIFSNSIAYALLYVVLLAAFFLPILIGTYYQIDAGILTIKSSFLHNQKIVITNITKIKETNDLISSPALSLDRLEIFLSRFESVLVSPKDKAAFIAELISLNPAIEVQYKKAK